MRKAYLIFCLVFLALFLLGCRKSPKTESVKKTMVPRSTVSFKDKIKLLEPQRTGKVSLEEAIQKRRSKRDFTDKSLSLEQLSQILWAAQGITGESWGVKLRSAPSAGALYPLEIYIVVKVNGVEGLETGVYHYLPDEHSLELHVAGDVYEAFGGACLEQGACRTAPLSLVIAAEYERTTAKYGERGERYVHLEVGHVGQNVYLEAEALGLGTVTIGAFDDERISKVLDLPQEYKPLYIMPIGWPE